MVRSKFLRKSGHAAKLVATNYRGCRTIESWRLLGNSISMALEGHEECQAENGHPKPKTATQKLS